MKIIRNNEHKTMEYDWLKTTHNFSFGEYYDSERINFGPLRVFNHDIIQPGKGFNFHQHKDMEIVTYVIDGELEHKDNFGNNGIIKPGEIQRMSAGTGVFHSEFNHSDKKPLRLLQMWIFAKYKNLKPSWEQQKFTKQERQNRLLPVISSTKENEKSMSINQDVSFYISNIMSEKTVKHSIEEGRQVYLYVIDGKVELNDNTMNAGDSAEITDAGKLTITAKKNSELILIEVPAQYVKNTEVVVMENKN